MFLRAGDLSSSAGSMGRQNIVAAVADGYYGAGVGGTHQSGGGGSHHHHHHHHGHHHHHHHNTNGNSHHHHHHHAGAATGVSAAIVDGQVSGGGIGGGGGVGYRVQRQTANIRERRRMLRSDLAPTRATDRPTPVKM